MEKKAVSAIMLTLLLMGMLTLAFNIRSVRAVTIIVPDDYPTIQAGINAASYGDTVYVRAGTYLENVVVNKALSLVGENPKTTTIDGSNGGIVVGIFFVPGIAVDINASYVNLTGFTVRNTGDWGVGITMVGPSYCNVYGNNITASNAYSEGVEVIKSSSNNRVFENSITAGGGIGIEWSCNNNYVAENNIVRCGVGVFLAYACSNNIVRNSITNSGYVGVDIGSYSYYNSVSGNNITNSRDAFDLGSYCDNNDIVGNNVVDNGVGVRIWADTPNNMFYHNSFIDNAQQISNNWGSTNVWDNGSNGNYWSDYTARYPNASETDGSGVWNTTYAIDANNVDRYPLVNQAIPPILLYTITIGAGGGGSVVYSCHSGSGSVPSGQTISLNVTLGTQISLTAYPSLSFVFQGWNTNDRVSTFNASSLSSTATANGDGSVTASFARVPTANFTWSPPMPISTKTVTFNASSSTPNSGTMASYTWNFGDGNTTTTMNPIITHRYADPKRYSVTLTVQNTAGVTGSITKNVGIMTVADINMDGKVDVTDLARVVAAFGSYPSHPKWNPACDINGDGIIDVYDVAYVCHYFGWYDP